MHYLTDMCGPVFAPGDGFSLNIDVQIHFLGLWWAPLFLRNLRTRDGCMSRLGRSKTATTDAYIENESEP